MTPSGENMEAHEMSSQEKDVLASKVMNSLGESEGSEAEINQSTGSEGEPNSSEGMDYAKALSSAKKRLKAQSMQHEREVRDLHARMAEMESRISPNQNRQEAYHYDSQAQPGSVEEHIQKAVSYALNQRDLEERKAKEAESMAHVQKKYRELQRHLDEMSDRYDDFHDTVLADDVQFTPAMRDYALTMPKKGPGSVGEVLYKLGKNREELSRISKLHPADQAEEMARLSHALITGDKGESTNQSRPLGTIKSTPVTNHHVVNDKTPISNIRDRMKQGKWK
jgi:chromosome segregation ATPase